MQLFLDTANIKELTEGFHTGIVYGITTNPTILKKEEKPRFDQLMQMKQFNPTILFVQTIGDSFDQRYADYQRLHTFGKENNIKIGIKVPMDFIGLQVVCAIKKEDPAIQILGTAIYSADQGMMAAMAGCDYLAPYYNRMLNQNINAKEVLAKMRAFIDRENLSTKILCASFKNSQQVLDALEAGSHHVTISLDVFQLMMNKELAVGAIEVFNRDGKIHG